MKVLFCIRDDYLKNFAGDTVQVLKTAEYLRKMGVEIYINKGDIDDYSDYDIIHLFNISRVNETYIYYIIAKKYNKPIVISPIYWNLNKFYEHIKRTNNWKQFNILREIILKGCKIIYPNSKLEMENIKEQFGMDLPFEVIYNGVDLYDLKIQTFNFKEKYQLDSYVLCVARICPRKNQLILAKVCRRLGIELVLIGNINDNNYFQKCLQYKNVIYLGFMNMDDLVNAYRFADLHVLPSFVETPGLSSLEAALAGCKIVSTEEGSSKEYFGDRIKYCNPYNENSIYNAIKEALLTPKNLDLKTHIEKSFSWEVCIKPLYDSYINLLRNV